MSTYLWSYFLQDDVESFQQVLAEASVAGRPNNQKGAFAPQSAGLSHSIGSPSNMALSPPSTSKARWHQEAVETASLGAFREVVLTKQDINRRDGRGMTILHHAASSVSENALAFALALLGHPHIDLFAQDHENGWTALHRAFYAGNIAIARAIIERESQLALGQMAGNASSTNAPSLIKTKDKEGHGPFDLYSATIADRTLDLLAERRAADESLGREDSDDDASHADEDEQGKRAKSLVQPVVDLGGDELYTFGSNKNVTLGFGDEDDRQRPERVKIKRPEHLFKRFYREHFERRGHEMLKFNTHAADALRAQARLPKALSELPSIIRSSPMTIQDVQMSKFHTAVLTSDPVSNLYVCGHGLGGRLGTGSEKTEFGLVCLQDFGAEQKRIVAVALGQDHSLAVTDRGELFTWGSNVHGQLGIGLPKAKTRPEDAVQLLPKQLFGTLKKEYVIGVAASAHHSVAHTSTTLFTWGRNIGQLGIVDSGARSLTAQGTPRNVTSSRFSSSIHSVTAIDRATICLLDSREVFVFANYGCVRLDFPLDHFSNYFLKRSVSSTKYDSAGPRKVCKITGGGDTVCVLSSAGEVYTVNVRQAVPDPSSSTTSTTNPNKIRASITTPTCVWSLKRDTMAARDVSVDQDGSVIISTQAGSVWRRVARAKAATKTTDKHKSKDFKFSRVPNLTRVRAVRASTSGAYCAIRDECDVTKNQIMVNQRSIWDEMFSLLSFARLAQKDLESADDPPSTFWRRPSDIEKLLYVISSSKDLEQDMAYVLPATPPSQSYDIVVSSTLSELSIPAHSFILAARSLPLRAALSVFRQSGEFANDTFAINASRSGPFQIKFAGLDFLTLVELVLYMYTDHFVGFWQYTRACPELAYRYAAVRTELMRTASRLDLRNLESAARRLAQTVEHSLAVDMDLAICDNTFFENGDAIVQLEDGEMPVHSLWLAKRCPFFEGLFYGRTGGQWLARRRELLDTPSDAVSVDLKHIETSTFKLVLRYLYADAGPELFEDVVTQDLDEFLDVVLDVLSVANELMLDRLAQVCQQVLGQHVTTRNICQLLNAVAPCSVTEFKDAALEYLCLNLETLLLNHWLDELDDDLILELDRKVRENQLAFLPIVKSGRAEADLFEKYPELASRMDRSRQARLDALKVQAKFNQNLPIGASFDVLDEDFFSSTPSRSRRSRHSRGSSASATPLLKAKAKALQEGIDEDIVASLPALSSPLLERSPPFSPSQQNASGQGTALEGSRHSIGRAGSSSVSPMLLPTDAGNLAQGPVTPTGSRSVAGAPWGSSPLPTAKLSMKEIMSQSATSTSSLSSGLRAQATAGISPVSNAQKMSQKERKKLQKQHSDAILEPAKQEGSPRSPWQTVPSHSKPVHPIVATNLPEPSKVIQQGRAQSTPHLTMRQTIANTPAAKASSSSPMTPDKPSPMRSAAQAKTDSPGSPSASASTALPIQSIRHIPTPRQEREDASVFMHQSLADIISQEQAGKDAIKEAVAKRSLQEIQQEQAFQEWWDAESRAVQAAAAFADHPASPGRGRGGARAGRGDRRRQGGGRGGAEGGRGEGGGGRGRAKAPSAT